jgi:PmbA protein
MLALTSSVPPLRDPLEGIRCGLLVENLLGVRMGNPLSGEFSNSVHVGYRIEDGVIVGRVKDLMVAGNVYALLADLEGLGARPEWDDDEALLPAVRARSVRVTSKA